MLHTRDLKKLEVEAIAEKAKELRKKLFDMKVEKSTAELEKTHEIRQTRRDIARCMTAIRQK